MQETNMESFDEYVVMKPQLRLLFFVSEPDLGSCFHQLLSVCASVRIKCDRSRFLDNTLAVVQFRASSLTDKLWLPTSRLLHRLMTSIRHPHDVSPFFYKFTGHCAGEKRNMRGATLSRVTRSALLSQFPVTRCDLHASTRSHCYWPIGLSWCIDLVRHAELLIHALPYSL